MTTRQTVFARAALAGVVTAASLLCVPVLAQEPAAASPAPAAIAAQIRKAYPKTSFDQINSTPITGVYEVVMGRNLAYTDATARYFLFGSNLYDMKTQTDLTQPKRDALAKIRFDQLPLSDAIKTVKGSGARHLAIFADPNCGYCKRLESEMAALDNVTIYTFLMPILSSDSIEKARNVWCSVNPQMAWKDLMVNGVAPAVAPAASSCQSPLERNVALGKSLGVSGTPTLIASDGRILPGFALAARIDAWLEGAQ